MKDVTTYALETVHKHGVSDGRSGGGGLSRRRGERDSVGLGRRGGRKVGLGERPVLSHRLDNGVLDSLGLETRSQYIFTIMTPVVH